MPLTPGTRLGRYEIRAMLGAGGMGEVYQAADASLKRDVAIKVLPAEFTSDAERLRRFQQEVLATAALNHPHIIAVHDVGTHEGTAYVVTELLEGRTLKEVLAAGPIPVRKALDYATQIAGGLAAAHEKGIVHRDLKPANLFVTNDERVKILDFGLARVLEGSPVDGEGATVTIPGSILGTVGYMSPEQVRGESADHRADIFAFGVVLYELLTGRRAFHRETMPGTLAAILHDDPPTWTGDGTSLSLRLLRLTRRCLEKVPAARFQSARDLTLVLSDEASDPSFAAALVQPSRRPALMAGMVAAAVVLILLGFWLGSRGGAQARSLGSDTPYTFRLTLPEGEAWADVPVISNDGRYVAHVLTQANIRRLHVLSLATGEWRTLPETERAGAPFFSHDGSQIAFIQDGKLKRIVLPSGRPLEICDAPFVRRASWGDDNHIVLGNRDGGLLRVAATGGTPEPLTIPLATENNHRQPFVLPGSRAVLFTITSAEDFGRPLLAVSDIGSRTHRVIREGSNPQYVNGHLIFAKRQGDVYAVPFDLETLQPRGAEIALAERPAAGNNLFDTSLQVATEGSMVYSPFVASRSRLQLADRLGNLEPLRSEPADYSAPRLSPDDTRLLVTKEENLSDVDVFHYSFAGRGMSALTDTGGDRWAVWAGPSGFMHSSRHRFEKVLVRTLEAGILTVGKPTQLSDARSAGPSDVVGDIALYGQEVSDGDWDIWTRPLDASQPGRRFLQRRGNQYGAVVSPDRKWIAYASNEEQAGRFEIYVTTYPTPSDPRKLSDDGGQGPRWSRSGAELFFMHGETVFTKRFGPGGPSAEPAVPAGVAPFASTTPGVPNYDVFKDGRFVIITQEPEPANARTPIVILNWASQLRSSGK